MACLSGDTLGNFHLQKWVYLRKRLWGCERKLFDRIEDSSIFPQTVFSDHSPIVISIANKLESKNEVTNDNNWHSLPKRIKWNHQSLCKLSKSLESIDQEELDKILEKN